MRFRPIACLTLLIPLLLSLPVHAEEASVALQTALRENGAGAIVDLGGLDPLTLPPMEAEHVFSGGKIVYSGSPEYCPGPGILYADTFTAGTDVRLYVYHVNASKVPLRFSVVLDPVGGPAVVEVRNSIVIGPGRDYFAIGRLSSFIQLGRPTPPRPRRMEIQAPALLDEDLDSRVVPPGRPEPLIHSLHDFQVVSGSVRVSVVAVEAEQPTLARYPDLAQLPRDRNHDRGTFAAFDEDVLPLKSYSTADGVAHLRLADGKVDPWTEGGDVTVGSAGAYRGGYGILYRVHLKTSAPDGRWVALVLNPRAGGLGGAVGVSVPRHGKSAHYAPSLSMRPVSAKEEAVILARWDPAVTPEVTIHWTPPGAASLPVEWLLIPYDNRPAGPAVAHR